VIGKIEKAHSASDLTDAERTVYTAYVAQQKVDRFGQLALGSAAAATMFINSRLRCSNLTKLALYALVIGGTLSLHKEMQASSTRQLFKLTVA
jgi:hypothetical protein